ncbi:MAG: hypothetical protein KDC68_06015 [Gelidibacter sp.]|nr:hypothetical protein [Gelidibacter sp.]
MKKIFLLLTCVSLLSTFTSCNDEEDIHVYDSGDIAYFEETASSLFVTSDNPSESIEIVSTVTSSADRTYNIQIDPSSTAVEGVEFTLGSSTLTIPAGEYFGTVTVNGIFDGALETGSTLVLNLTSTTNEVATFDTTHTVSIFKLCESNLGGTYEVTTTYGYHDFLPDFNPHTTMMDIEALGNGNYFVQDFSGGLYTEGPYASAYGTGPTSFDLIFTDVCGNISWVDQSDPWGSVEMDGVNSVDPDTGVITTSWYCTGYGENGVSVYVPQ